MNEKTIELVKETLQLARNIGQDDGVVCYMLNYVKERTQNAWGS